MTELYASYFRAQIIDLKTDEVSVVEFYLDDVSKDDLPLCKPGALFYWTIGKVTRPSGQVENTSVIRFRRLGKSRRQ
ncbi:hypothetical protein [Protofrankia symbiont of Coriaria ruscifolia]|uniref:hypothetical protein n=1 Tax=Protofrankia symbiont of Coriaria ruscifolia TaxID=1306542 RepID=UPI001040F5E5|nr:hypothetical protein [Protofrankia symbiont of Coriaria ruscifolia]